MKVGIVGFGSIGTEVAKALINGVEDFSLFGIVSRSRQNALKRISDLNQEIKIFDLEELVENCDIIIDCAPKEAFRQIASKCINKKKTLITVSGSGLLDNLDLEALAKKNETQIILATGAILGLDALRAASESKINEVKMITRKPPNALLSAPYVIDNNINLDNLSEPKLIFKGSASEGAKAFPANVNVAAAVGLASIGADKTKLEIWADPSLDRNTHKVEVDADSAIFQMSIQNVQTPENPGTGKITGLSVVACLRGLMSPFKIGT
ncbi:MAG: aspartate dehydrogenase [Proteobacteria bacterium]|nr:aspartate dehydrogenase [Pseudomonadota bacterium]